jgi:hypothetical protein
MDAWLGVRSQLSGVAVEIDQKFLSEEPEVVSKRLAQFLSRRREKKRSSHKPFVTIARNAPRQREKKSAIFLKLIGVTSNIVIMLNTAIK